MYLMSEYVQVKSFIDFATKFGEYFSKREKGMEQACCRVSARDDTW